jgi:hypothetical protein
MGEPIIKIVGENKVIEIKTSARGLMFNNFLSGIAWGFGTVVGATVVFTLLVFLISKLNTAPIIGGYISHIMNNIPSTPPSR